MTGAIDRLRQAFHLAAGFEHVENEAAQKSVDLATEDLTEDIAEFAVNEVLPTLHDLVVDIESTEGALCAIWVAGMVTGRIMEQAMPRENAAGLGDPS